MKIYLSALAAAALAFAVASPAAALTDVTIYTSRDAFLAAIHNAATDTFDDLAVTDGQTDVVRTVGDYSYTADASQLNDSLYVVQDGGNAMLSNNRSDAEIDLMMFSGGSNAVGFDVLNTAADGSVLPYTDISVLAIRLAQTDPYTAYDTEVFDLTGDTGRFIGFIWNKPAGQVPYLQVFTRDSSNSFAAIDNLTVGIANPAAVPEPVTWAFMLTGFGAVGAALRRRPQTAAA